MIQQINNKYDAIVQLQLQYFVKKLKISDNITWTNDFAYFQFVTNTQRFRRPAFIGCATSSKMLYIDMTRIKPGPPFKHALILSLLNIKHPDWNQKKLTEKADKIFKQEQPVS